MERIIYAVDEPVKFEANETKVSLVSAKVANAGNKTASNVVVVMETDDQTTIIEHKLQMSSGSAVQYENVMVEDHRISVSLEVFVPSEILTISAMLDGIAEANPRVSVRSASSVGEPGQLISDNDAEKWPIIKAALAPIIALGWGGALFWIWRWRRFGISEMFRSVNDLAFLYIHQGLVEEAEEVLRQYINKKGASAYELLNYGLALALTGKREDAQKYFASGEWLARSNYARGLAEFNRSIASVATDDLEGARGHLKRAFELSPRQISGYCEFSVQIKEAIEKDKGIAQIVDTQGKE